MRPLKKKRKVEVKFLKKVPLHPRYRSARKTRESNDKKVKISTVYTEITKQVPQHPRDRLAEEVNEWKSKLNEPVDEILLTNVIPQYLRERLRRRIMELNGKISFMKKVPQHPRDRPSQKVKELIKNRVI